MICVLADLRIKTGSQDVFFAAAREMIKATLAEPGCIRYDLMQDITEPDHLTFVEEWESREALAAHFETAHMAVWRKASAPHLTGRDVRILHIGDVETL